MKVIATKVGFYGKLRKVGEEFVFNDKILGSWMKEVETKKPTPKKAVSKKKS